MAEDQARTVTVHYFAALVDAVGCRSEELVVSERTVGGLRAAVAERHGAQAGDLAGHCSVLVGDELVRDDAAAIGSDVDLLPPFAGG